ncbi:ketopantoate hydroxymethyltransferase-domain-containing protein [Xylaria bambusicola]|uniref:ketopantoate hydroxymethyltransferase-domain-containing protein n=1 Tax=Xylaria bambusicola TaxID=326684 RepID=UPI002008390A|nr:ketopantoate hydroxymethyltransferase-domain-containing protein [Xylaria bambusicola]KAI0514948.1 ketopantoate hydroxymethyltransferase-domain-containing protein [Xylaria bambusicola]
MSSALAKWSSHSPLGKSLDPTRKKVTMGVLRSMYKKNEPISVMTAHDFPSAHVADAAGIDVILVGDSLAMVALGMEDTSEITIDDMLLHCKSVARATKAAFTIGDLPMGSYEVSPEQALATAIRFVKEGRVQGIKLEGGKEMAPTIKKIVQAGIPVLAHVGLTPQRQNALGGFRVQGKTAKGAMGVLEDALAVQEAGCFAMVVEAVPAEVASIITSKLSVPTIGIGAGNGCSGQVLVQVDMSGNFPPGRTIPKFVKQYGNVWAESLQAIESYREEVKSRQYPAPEHTYPISKEELDAFTRESEKNSPSVGFRDNILRRCVTTVSNFCVALILRTSVFSCGADPTALKRTRTFSWSNPPAEAKAELASRGRAVSTVDAVMVSGSSGDSDLSWIGEGGGEGEGRSGYSIFKIAYEEQTREGLEFLRKVDNVSAV